MIFTSIETWPHFELIFLLDSIFVEAGGNRLHLHILYLWLKLPNFRKLTILHISKLSHCFFMVWIGSIFKNTTRGRFFITFLTRKDKLVVLFDELLHMPMILDSFIWYQRTKGVISIFFLDSAWPVTFDKVIHFLVI